MNLRPPKPGLDALRWLLCASVVVGVHMWLVAALLSRENEPPAEAEPTAAMVVELAEIPVAAANLPANVPPGPEQIEAKAAPEQTKEEEKQETGKEETPAPTKEEEPEVKPAPNPEVAVDEQKKEEIKKETKKAPEAPPAPVTSAPQAIATQTAAVAAAPRQGAPVSSTSTSVPKWMSKISALLERNKRYPQTARLQRAQGVVVLAFSIDREGHVLASAVKSGSGYPVLDEEALQLLQRAQPFPPVPADVPGAKVSLSVPIRFDVR
jgi:protein TonB